MDLQRCWDCDKFHAPMLVCTQTKKAAKSMVSCPLEAPGKELSSKPTEEETAPLSRKKNSSVAGCRSASQEPAKEKPMDDQGVVEKLLRIEELAAYLGVPKSWVYEKSRLRKRNGFPVLKCGKYLRLDLGAVRQWAGEQAKKA